mmetsp:Transcript_28694/g.82449  ORF Transcript_28694/g.82449 Transcript_28694/m.82449 type:complete len:126 (-) Transcript_28694:63-440(-)
MPCWGKGKGKGNGVSFSINTLIDGFVSGDVFPPADKSQEVQLYVDGLPPDTSDYDLFKLFAPFGCPIRPNGVKVMKRPDGACSGVGFVDILDAGSAQMAMTALHGTNLPDGSFLKVQQKRMQGGK